MFVALVIHHAKCVICIILSSAACLALPWFTTLSHKQLDCWKNVTEHELCFDFLHNVCQKHFSLSEEFGEVLSSVHIGRPVKYPLFLSDFNLT